MLTLLCIITSPTLNTSLQLPEFTVHYAGREDEKCPSEYLLSNVWVDTFKATVKGVGFGNVNESMIDKSKWLVLAMRERFELHVAQRVDRSRLHHYTLDFIRDNLASMSAAKCLVGHIVDNHEFYNIDDCLLVLPTENAVFQSISQQTANSELGSSEGCYLHYDGRKKKWIRSGKASGAGANACFDGRLDTHTKNARNVDQTRKHRFYQEYPAKGVKHIGGI